MFLATILYPLFQHYQETPMCFCEAVLTLEALIEHVENTVFYI